MAGPISMKSRIEYVKKGDVVRDKGEVVEVIDRKHTSFIRLVIRGGKVVEGSYGKKVSILRPIENLNGIDSLMAPYLYELEKSIGEV